ncbi:4-alpha-glucanotransferase [Acidocella sp.]|jgi:4-alpha-glucanotransferase|uniref:4-alpha-glucanotransferase n=1 Tax=Acidocella sp. TaxID=50710 RepID=UPI002F3F1D53
MSALHELARAAGLQTAWRDVSGAEQIVSDDSLRAVLAALGFPAGNEADISDSLATLRAETSQNSAPPPLITAAAGEPIFMPGPPGRYRLTLETGETVEGIAEAQPNGIALPPVQKPGYHGLELGRTRITLAVAPPRSYTLEDAAQGAKLWGLTVQLYALRREHDGGIGDFSALADFCTQAARRGADAIGISPVHALFAADLTRFSPYAPSNRAALNVLHIAHDSAASNDAALIDWPRAAAAKFHALREVFDQTYSPELGEQIHAELGPEQKRHALFEALMEKLSQDNPSALDWRNWPAAYQHPDNPAVARFAQQAAQKIGFHAWLQWRADRELGAAQEAARAAGARIGLIADLAVGTDPSGSHSWSRQDEVLQGLEIGAPPDLVNREGQSWGITAFSPRGLRRSGFSAFIDMLRHALRHAGGVRIDHVMGLTRLWVVPQGLPSAQGAYLTMPADDLMRLVALESYRHKAVILGEDLGTLPPGFGAKLHRAGISGLRVMWFERDGATFTPPQSWTKSAVAMTTTHDLPTVAGWWEGTDIGWREKLHMSGDTPAQRDADRRALWSAFTTSGATTPPPPPPQDGAAAADAAASHLGRAGCTLALLPVEDALAACEQPNLPGTIDAHPNWRRRLTSNAETLFSRADFSRRLTMLANARRTSESEGKASFCEQKEAKKLY